DLQEARRTVLVALLGLLEFAVAGQSTDFLRDVRPILEKHCFECHSGDEPKGGVDLSLAQDGGEARRMGSVFPRAISMVERRKMPPESGRPLKDDERVALVAALKDVLSHPEPGESLDPGRVVLRRLSRFEFDHAIHDLLGARYDSSAIFPADPIC